MKLQSQEWQKQQFGQKMKSSVRIAAFATLDSIF